MTLDPRQEETRVTAYEIIKMLKSACACAQYDQSLRCRYVTSNDPWLLQQTFTVFYEIGKMRRESEALLAAYFLMERPKIILHRRQKSLNWKRSNKRCQANEILLI